MIMQVIYKLLLLFGICFCCFSTKIWAYKIPNVKLELLQGEGFRISIPDEDGIKQVAFNINRNRPFETLSQGEISVQLRDPISKRWIYQSKRHLNENDVIYVWVNVQYKEYNYHRTYDAISVGEFIRSSSDSNETQSGELDIRINNDNKNKVCTPTITVVKGRKLCKDQVIFEETFNRALNQKRWKHEFYMPLDNGDAEFVVYNTNAEVSDGVLKIVPKLWNDDNPGTDIRQGVLDLGVRCTGKINPVLECKREAQRYAHNVLPPIISARINTKDTFSFKYGRVDIRAKLPRGDWLFPLLLLEPLNNQYGLTPYASGEIRIAFARGNEQLLTKDQEHIDGSRLYGGAILTTGAEFRNKSMVQRKGNEHFGQEFHIYTVIWDNEKLVFMVDDDEYGRVVGNFYEIYGENNKSANSWKTGEYMAPFDQQFFITLGLSAGGHGDFPDECQSNNHMKPWENTSPKAAYRFWQDRSNWKSTWTNPALEVDYVRVTTI